MSLKSLKSLCLPKVTSDDTTVLPQHLRFEVKHHWLAIARAGASCQINVNTVMFITGADYLSSRPLFSLERMRRSMW